MNREEGSRYVGSVLTVLGTQHLIARYDAPRQVFIIRNLRRDTDGREIVDRVHARTLEDAIADGIATLTKRGSRS